MKQKIAIEEVRTQIFEIEIEEGESAYEKVQKEYLAGNLKLNDEESNLVEVNIDTACDGNWSDLHGV